MASIREELAALKRILELAVGRQGQTGLAPLLQLINAAIGGQRVQLPDSIRRLLRASLGPGYGIPYQPRPSRQPDDPDRPFVQPIPGTPRGHPPGNVVRTPEEPPQFRRGYAPQGYPEEQPNFSDEFLAPTSSNVYSFQYYRRPRDTTGILYVTFRASALKATGLVGGPGRHPRGRKQLHGIPGHVHGQHKLNAPGPTYAYFKVPPNLFTRMKTAHSKGKFVWDELRIRGTVYGHKFQYNLVVGQIVEGIPGFAGAQYIPRKATKRGFVTRSVSDIGMGRRSFVSSTLPPSTGGTGFTTRRR